ncbi:MAG: phosphoesterase [Candidatus Bathyarchaeota archaeon]|nr:phosphoesterase [Candidatus Bathyarchaeota archaeon]
MEEKKTRIFHATDPHGNELIWRKYLKTSVNYKADVIMLFGDLTGKAIVPIVKRESDWYSAPFGKTERYFSREEVDKKIKSIRDEGLYAIEMSESDARACQEDEKKMDALFQNVMCETMDRWVSMVEEQVPKGIQVIVSPGNDDHLAIDDVIKKHERVIYPLNKAVDIGDKYKLISCEWVNPTPWLTPRECPEEELMKKLDREFSRVDRYDDLLCNFHAPPFGTILDVAPKLDKTLKPVAHFGSVETESVGSKAVLDAIMKYQPLLGLHGHIHECNAHTYLGKTLCVNPGSDYRKGILRGYVVDLPSPENPKMECWRVEG